MSLFNRCLFKILEKFMNINNNCFKFELGGVI